MALETIKVLGIKFFEGDVNGKIINSGKIFVEEILDPTKGNAKGSASQEYRLKSSEEVKQLMKYDFPMLCEVEFVRVTTGKESRTIVNRVTPVNKSAPPPPPR